MNSVKKQFSESIIPVAPRSKGTSRQRLLSVDPEDGYVLGRVATATRGRAASLHDPLRGAGLRCGWLTAVVVIWGDFEQGCVESNRTLWIHGKQLAKHVHALPPRLERKEIDAIATYLRYGKPANAYAARS